MHLLYIIIQLMSYFPLPYTIAFKKACELVIVNMSNTSYRHSVLCVSVIDIGPHAYETIIGARLALTETRLRHVSLSGATVTYTGAEMADNIYNYDGNL